MSLRKSAVATNDKKTKNMSAKPVKAGSTNVKKSVKKKTTPTNGSTTKSTEEKAELIKKPLPRYSDAKLKEFEELLQRREAKERDELKLVNDYLNSNNEKGGLTEDGSAVGSEKENLNQQKGRIITTLSNIEKAYDRIRNKTYGRCTTTHELIDEARLRAHPWATQSIVAKMGSSK